MRPYPGSMLRAICSELTPPGAIPVTCDENDGTPLHGRPFKSVRFAGPDMIIAVVEPTLKTFTCFPNLPFELRLKIWEHIIEPETPSIVEIDIKRKTDSHEYRRLIRSPKNILYSILGKKTKSGILAGNYDIRPVQIPAVLHVCNESRAEALRYYKLCFGIDAWHPPRTYVKISRNTSEVVDQICIDFPNVYQKKLDLLQNHEELDIIGDSIIANFREHSIKCLGIHYVYHERASFLFVRFQMRICQALMPGLEEIYVILDEPKKIKKGRDSLKFVDIRRCGEDQWARRQVKLVNRQLNIIRDWAHVQHLISPASPEADDAMLTANRCVCKKMFREKRGDEVLVQDNVGRSRKMWMGCHRLFCG